MAHLSRPPAQRPTPFQDLKSCLQYLKLEVVNITKDHEQALRQVTNRVLDRKLDLQLESGLPCKTAARFLHQRVVPALDKCQDNLESSLFCGLQPFLDEAVAVMDDAEETARENESFFLDQKDHVPLVVDYLTKAYVSLKDAQHDYFTLLETPVQDMA